MASFEENLKKLEESVALLEEGGLPLKKTVQLYEEALKYSKACTDELEIAKKNVELLSENGGKLTTQPLSEKNSKNMSENL